MVDVSRAGREYVSWPLTGLPDDYTTGLEVSVDEATWLPVEVVAGSARVLAAGPDATGNPAGTLILTAGRHRPVLRLTDNPEVILRGGGVIDVV